MYIKNTDAYRQLCCLPNDAYQFQKMKEQYPKRM